MLRSPPSTSAIGRSDARYGTLDGLRGIAAILVAFFHFQQRLALGDLLAFLLEPGDELAGFLRHFQCGHDNANGHKNLVTTETQRHRGNY